MNIPQEIIDKIDDYVIDNATLPAVRSQLKNRILFGYHLRDDEVAELKKAVIEGSELYVNFITKSKGLVWDYSDIAIKFKHWIPEKEFENENAAFTFFFQEVYNKDFR